MFCDSTFQRVSLVFYLANKTRYVLFELEDPRSSEQIEFEKRIRQDLSDPNLTDEATRRIFQDKRTSLITVVNHDGKYLYYFYRFYAAALLLVAIGTVAWRRKKKYI